MIQEITWIIVLFYAFLGLSAGETLSRKLGTDGPRSSSNYPFAEIDESARREPTQIEVFNTSIADQVVAALYPGSLSKRQFSRLNYGTRVGTLALAGYVGLNQGLGAVVVREACFNPDTRGVAECIDLTAWQSLKVGISIAAASEYAASDVGLVQGALNLFNEFSGYAQPSPQPQQPGGGSRGMQRMGCPVNDQVNVIPVRTTFRVDHYGTKVSCTSTCYQRFFFDADLEELVRRASEALVYNDSLVGQGTIFDTDNGHVYARCRFELNTVRTDTCPTGIDGGDSCVYQGLPVF
ncbi:Hypothetical protein D9617_4g003300 [Elsinoe fawcettii]|nr:Hypothetical protein D9617_4g003300 [Elsinoe fawcettii]